MRLSYSDAAARPNESNASLRRAFVSAPPGGARIERDELTTKLSYVSIPDQI
jgi:hypothetical protein